MKRKVTFYFRGITELQTNRIIDAINYHLWERNPPKMWGNLIEISSTIENFNHTKELVTFYHSMVKMDINFSMIIQYVSDDRMVTIEYRSNNDYRRFLTTDLYNVSLYKNY